MAVFTLVFWIVLAIVFIILEAESQSLITIWFGVGAIITAIAAGFGMEIVWQIVLFIVSSSAILFFIRPYLKVKSKTRVPVNADRNIGKKGTIITPATAQEMGQIKIGGQVWSYMPEDGKQFEIGEKAVVLRIEGVKVIVDKVV